MKKVYLGSDHAGYLLKEQIKRFLDKLKVDYQDLGAFSEEPTDYPKIAHELAEKVAKNNSKGILMCGTGIGEVIVANKTKGIRAANCFDEYTARKCREHNNANVLCLGARIMSMDDAKSITKIWLETDFSKEKRHNRRVNQISEIETNICKNAAN